MKHDTYYWWDRSGFAPRGPYGTEMEAQEASTEHVRDYERDVLILREVSYSPPPTHLRDWKTTPND